MSNETKSSESNPVESMGLLERTSNEMWNICADTCVDQFNDEIDNEEWTKRVEKFTEVLANFQRETFPTRKL